MRQRGALAMIYAEAAQIVNDEDFSLTQQLKELKEVMIELELQARKQIEILEIFDSTYLDLLAESNRNIEALKQRKVCMPDTPQIKKSWKVKTTIRGRLPHY